MPQRESVGVVVATLKVGILKVLYKPPISVLVRTENESGCEVVVLGHAFFRCGQHFVGCSIILQVKSLHDAWLQPDHSASMFDDVYEILECFEIHRG